MHPDHKYLRELIENQLTVLSSKKRRCIWHPKVMDFATAIYTASPSAYAEAIAGGILALPSYSHVKKCARKGSTVARLCRFVTLTLSNHRHALLCSPPDAKIAAAKLVPAATGPLVPQVPTGKCPELTKRLGAELDKLGVPDELRDGCLIWDEVNLLGQVPRHMPIPSASPHEPAHPASRIPACGAAARVQGCWPQVFVLRHRGRRTHRPMLQADACGAEEQRGQDQGAQGDASALLPGGHAPRPLVVLGGALHVHP